MVPERLVKGNRLHMHVENWRLMVFDILLLIV